MSPGHLGERLWASGTILCKHLLTLPSCLPGFARKLADVPLHEDAVVEQHQITLIIALLIIYGSIDLDISENVAASCFLRDGVEIQRVRCGMTGGDKIS
jgi:hypothetical protein